MRLSLVDTQLRDAIQSILRSVPRILGKPTLPLQAGAAGPTKWDAEPPPTHRGSPTKGSASQHLRKLDSYGMLG